MHRIRESEAVRSIPTVPSIQSRRSEGLRTHPGRGVGGNSFRCLVQYLVRHLATQFRVSSPIHFSHTTSAEERRDLVGAEPTTGLKDHETVLILHSRVPPHLEDRICWALLQDQFQKAPQQLAGLRGIIEIGLALPACLKLQSPEENLLQSIVFRIAWAGHVIGATSLILVGSMSVWREDSG